MIAPTVVRLIAATLPAGVRERYREEWASDLAGAAELGIRPASLVAGALGVALRIDRDDPAVSGLAPRRLAFRRLRVALPALGSALLLLVFGVLWGAWAGADARGDIPLSSFGTGLTVAVMLGAVVGLGSLVGAWGASRRGRARRRWNAADTAVAITLPLAIAATLVMPFVSVPMLLAALIALLVLVTVEDPRAQARPLSRPAAVALAVLSAAGILAALAGSLLHVYVWNPLARMPGMTLDEIYAGLAAAGELPSPVIPIVWAALWCLGAIALVALAALPHPRIRRFATARRLAGVGIAGVAVITGGSWMLGFGMGMGMADAFGTSGGDAAATGPALAVVGVVFAIAALLVGLLPTRIRPTPPGEMQEIPLPPSA